MAGLQMRGPPAITDATQVAGWMWSAMLAGIQASGYSSPGNMEAAWITAIQSLQAMIVWSRLQLGLLFDQPDPGTPTIAI